MSSSSASLLTAISIFISIFPTSALHPTFISVLSVTVGSRLHFANSILTGNSSRNIYRLRRAQTSLARVITRSTTNTSALNSLHCFQFGMELILYWLNLAALVHLLSTTWALNTCYLTLHCVSFAICRPQWSSPNLVSTLLLPLGLFGMLTLVFGIPSLLIWYLSNHI